MISVDEALARILAPLAAVPAETVSVGDGWNRVLAAPVVARLDQPPADVSAMDGYALRAEDGHAGASLAVIGAAPAGRPFAGAVGPGEAVRIFTGSVVPDGADCVVMQEDAERAGERCTLAAAARPGRHIRRRGHDFRAGDHLLAAGRRLSARDIGLAAAANHPWLSVHRRPRIALLATGDELGLPGEPIPPGGIVNSNALALAGLVRAAGGEPVVLPLVRDEPAALAAVAARLGGFEMLVTIGGASVGEHDLVRSVLTAHGLELDFWKIAMRPGKPLIHGRMGRMAMLGLPGNPVSAMVCAILFLRPAIAVLAGGTPAALPVRRARLATGLPANDERADFLRTTLSLDGRGWLALPSPTQDSSHLRVLAGADGLICRAPYAGACAGGAEVEVLTFADLGI